MVLKKNLTEFKKKFYQFSIDDNLVNFNATKAIEAEQTLIFKKPVVKSLLKEAIFFEKESGINSLCLVQGIVKLNYRYKIINTPVLIKSCRFIEDKVNEIVRFECEDEAFEINPFLQFYLKEFFDKDEPKIELKGYNKNQKSFKKTNKTNNNKTLKKK
jgi:acyl carrier protein